MLLSLRAARFLGIHSDCVGTAAVVSVSVHVAGWLVAGAFRECACMLFPSLWVGPFTLSVPLVHINRAKDSGACAAILCLAMLCTPAHLRCYSVRHSSAMFDTSKASMRVERTHRGVQQLAHGIRCVQIADALAKQVHVCTASPLQPLLCSTNKQ